MSEWEKLAKIVKDNDRQSLITNCKNIRNIDSATIRIDIYGGSEGNNESRIPEDGLTLLHVAAYYDSFECFAYLHLERKIPLRQPSSHSFLPLHYACWNGSTEVALYILTNDPTEAQYIVEGANELQLLNCSLIGGDIEIVKELLEKGAKYDQQTLINKAICLRRADFLKLIYQNLQNSRFTSDTPLTVKAVFEHSPESLEIFYNGKEDIISKIPNKPNQNLISLICDFDHSKKFKNILINRILKDAKDLNLEPTNPSIPGICHWACLYSDVDTAKAMFKLPGFDINRIGDGKTGPSEMSNKRGKEILEMIELLIDNGFEINNTHDGKVPTLLESFVFISVPNYEAIKFLLNKGADVDAKVINPANNKGNNISIFQYVMKSLNQRLKRLFKEAYPNK